MTNPLVFLLHVHGIGVGHPDDCPRIIHGERKRFVPIKINRKDND